MIKKDTSHNLAQEDSMNLRDASCEALYLSLMNTEKYSEPRQTFCQWRIRIKCCHISKISNEVGRIDNFRALARKLSFLPTELDIFDIWQQYARILFIFQRLTC